MEREVASLEKGAVCCSWNNCGRRLAVGYLDGSISIHDSLDAPASSGPSFKWKAHASCILNVVWAPPECGDAVACVCDDGTFSLWEEIEEDTQPPTLKLCKLFEGNGSCVLDLQFGIFLTSLKMVAAYSNGYIKVFELLDPLELNKWQLQIKCRNVVILAATNVCELETQWDCLLELPSSPLVQLKPFTSKHLRTMLSDVEIAQTISKLCLEFSDIYIGCYRKSRIAHTIISFVGKDKTRIELAAGRLSNSFPPGSFKEEDNCD